MIVTPAERRRIVRELQAELALLELFNVRRRAAGHDYGAGQRHRELVRVRRELELQLDRLELELDEPTHDELVAAFERVGRPKLRRLELEGYRSHTPASTRTRRVWTRLALELEVSPPLAKLRELVAAGVAAGDAIVEVTCEGHPAGEFEPMGETTYCDGSCVTVTS